MNLEPGDLCPLCRRTFDVDHDSRACLRFQELDRVEDAGVVGWSGWASVLGLLDRLGFRVVHAYTAFDDTGRLLRCSYVEPALEGLCPHAQAHVLEQLKRWETAADPLLPERVRAIYVLAGSTAVKTYLLNPPVRRL